MNLTLETIYALKPLDDAWERMVEASWALPPGDVEAFIRANNIKDVAWVLAEMGEVSVLVDACKAITDSVKGHGSVWSMSASAGATKIENLRYADRMTVAGIFVECVHDVCRAVQSTATKMQYAQLGNTTEKGTEAGLKASAEQMRLNKEILITILGARYGTHRPDQQADLAGQEQVLP